MRLQGCHLNICMPGELPWGLAMRTVFLSLKTSKDRASLLEQDEIRFIPTKAAEKGVCNKVTTVFGKVSKVQKLCKPLEIIPSPCSTRNYLVIIQ